MHLFEPGFESRATNALCNANDADTCTVQLFVCRSSPSRMKCGPGCSMLSRVSPGCQSERKACMLLAAVLVTMAAAQVRMQAQCIAWGRGRAWQVLDTGQGVSLHFQTVVHSRALLSPAARCCFLLVVCMHIVATRWRTTPALPQACCYSLMYLWGSAANCHMWLHFSWLLRSLATSSARPGARGCSPIKPSTSFHACLSHGCMVAGCALHFSRLCLFCNVF